MTLTMADRTDTEAGATRLLLVDDQRLLGETLQAALVMAGFDAAVSPCSSTEEVLAEARAVRPTLVVLDLELERAGQGYDLIGPLRAMGADVLVLTSTTDRIALARCLEAGALGVVSKAVGFGTVLDGIRRAADGEWVTPVNDRNQLRAELDAHRRTEAHRRALLASLSPRERAVLSQIVEGNQAAAIAAASYVSVPTVRTQIRSILQKLEVNSQLAAVALARRHGWFEPSRIAFAR